MSVWRYRMESSVRNMQSSLQTTEAVRFDLLWIPVAPNVCPLCNSQIQSYLLLNSSLAFCSLIKPWSTICWIKFFSVACPISSSLFFYSEYEEKFFVNCLLKTFLLYSGLYIYTSTFPWMIRKNFLDKSPWTITCSNFFASSNWKFRIIRSNFFLVIASFQFLKTSNSSCRDISRCSSILWVLCFFGSMHVCLII